MYNLTSLVQLKLKVFFLWQFAGYDVRLKGLKILEKYQVSLSLPAQVIAIILDDYQKPRIELQKNM